MRFYDTRMANNCREELNAKGSPIQWATQRFPNFERIYNAPLFEVLLLSNEHESLTHFTNNILWREGRINRNHENSLQAHSFDEVTLPISDPGARHVT